MTDEINNKMQIQRPRGKVRELVSEHSDGEPDKVNPNRERFLAHLKSQFGYTNEKAVDELKRLLKQFYRTNRSLGIHHAPRNYLHLHID
jgi:hypothetical protein